MRTRVAINLIKNAQGNKGAFKSVKSADGKVRKKLRRYDRKWDGIPAWSGLDKKGRMHIAKSQYEDMFAIRPFGLTKRHVLAHEIGHTSKKGRKWFKKLYKRRGKLLEVAKNNPGKKKLGKVAAKFQSANLKNERIANRQAIKGLEKAGANKDEVDEYKRGTNRVYHKTYKHQALPAAIGNTGGGMAKRILKQGGATMADYREIYAKNPWMRTRAFQAKERLVELEAKLDAIIG